MAIAPLSIDVDVDRSIARMSDHHGSRLKPERDSVAPTCSHGGTITGSLLVAKKCPERTPERALCKVWRVPGEGRNANMALVCLVFARFRGVLKGFVVVFSKMATRDGPRAHGVFVCVCFQTMCRFAHMSRVFVSESSSFRAISRVFFQNPP